MSHLTTLLLCLYVNTIYANALSVIFIYLETEVESAQLALLNIVIEQEFILLLNIYFKEYFTCKYLHVYSLYG